MGQDLILIILSPPISLKKKYTLSPLSQTAYNKNFYLEQVVNIFLWYIKHMICNMCL